MRLLKDSSRKSESFLQAYVRISKKKKKKTNNIFKSDIIGLVQLLRACLLRNIAGFGKLELHTKCHVGTKRLIEDCMHSNYCSNSAALVLITDVQILQR